MLSTFVCGTLSKYVSLCALLICHYDLIRLSLAVLVCGICICKNRKRLSVCATVSTQSAIATTF